MMTNVLIVTGSREMRLKLSSMLMGDPSIHVAMAVSSEADAMQYLSDGKIDIVVIENALRDIHPCDLTRKIMETHPHPVILINRSSRNTQPIGSQRGLDSGALAVLHFHSPVENTESQQLTEQFCRTVKTMAEIKVVKRWGQNKFRHDKDAGLVRSEMRHVYKPIEAVAIGASAGGTKALRRILSSLREKLDIPLFIVQHISRGHDRGLAGYLQDSCAMEVCLPVDGQDVEKGTVYLGPYGVHMEIGKDKKIRLVNDRPVNGFMPSIGRMFDSLRAVYGMHAVGVLLSGMGDDGAREMKRLYDSGAITIVQDRESSLIHGIPGEAIKLSAARYILSLTEIGPAITAFVQRSRKTTSPGMSNVTAGMSNVTAGMSNVTVGMSNVTAGMSNVTAGKCGVKQILTRSES